MMVLITCTWFMLKFELLFFYSTELILNNLNFHMKLYDFIRLEI